MGNLSVSFDERPDRTIYYNVPGDALRKHCNERAEYHKSRSEFFAQQEEKFKDEVKSFQESLPPDRAGFLSSGGIMTGTIMNNRERMAQQKTTHDDRRRYFRFCALYLKKDNYDLTDSEARQFEFI
jgi:hypothetical protein